MDLESNDAISITEWLDQARDGVEAGRQQLWARYYERLVRRARTRLSAKDRRVADEEDVALLAFAAFFRALDEGRLTELENRDDFWRVLVAIADNKANDQIRHQRRMKRGAGQVRGHSGFVGESGDQFEQVPDPSPEFAEEFGLVCHELLASLREDLRRIAIWKLEGYTNKEISNRLGCVEEAVRRKVVLIRKEWAKDHA